MKSPKLPGTVLANEILNDISTSGMFMLGLGAIKRQYYRSRSKPVMRWKVSRLENAIAGAYC